MYKFFSLFGKLMLVLVVVGILVGGGYYLGKKYNIPLPGPAQPTAMVSESPTSAVQFQAISPTLNQTQADPHVAVTSGGIYSFSKYILSAFKDWTVTKTKDNTIDKVVIAKGGYQITILQGAMGGGGCTFPGDTNPQAMSVELTSSTDIQLLVGKPLRRGESGSDAATRSYAVCQQTPDGQHYSTFTDFGVISYTTPLNPDTETLAMMDVMIGSLQKQ